MLLALFLSCTSPTPFYEGPPGMRAAGWNSEPSLHLPLPAQTICPDGETSHGIDVSYWQGSIQWNHVAADGVDFAYIRVSYGLEFYDSEFTNNWNGARNAGIYRGAYQYFLAGQDAGEQARMLLDAIGEPQAGDLPPVLDVESYGNEGVSSATVDAGIREWATVVEEALGRKPLIYTSWGVWDGMTGSTGFGDLPLWVANWGVTCPSVPDGWNSWDFWQTTDSGSVSGISSNVDLDQFNGNLEALDSYATWAGDIEDTGSDDTSSGDTAACDCSEARDQAQVCSDGGVRRRECDGCLWSDWSTCEDESLEESSKGGCACGTLTGSGAGWLTIWMGLALVLRRRGGGDGPYRTNGSTARRSGG